MRKIALLSLLFISACLPNGANESSVLTISECELPCWNDITPGATTMKEAIEVLEKTEEIGKDNVKVFYPSLETDFSLFLEVPGINRLTSGLIESRNGKVLDLRLMENLNVTFDEMTQQIGLPEYVISAPFIGGGNSFVLLYPSKGVSLDIWYDEKEISSETKITSLILFNPSDYEYLLGKRVFSDFDENGIKEIIYPWKGYGNIEELYPPRFP